MKRYLLIIGAILLGLTVRAQSVTYTCRYWFDRDMGQAVTTTFSEGSWQEELDVGSLSHGLHTLHLQAMDTSMKWSAPQSFMFLKVNDMPVPNITYDYWFDRDLENKMSSSVGNGQLFLDVDALTEGMHTLHVMMIGTEYNAVQSYLFLKANDIPVADITFDYWFDRDFENKVSSSVGDGHLLLDVDTLTEGMHTLHVMMIGTEYNAVQSYLFLKMDATDYTYRCWFDHDMENQQSNTLGSGSLLLDVSDLKEGMHTVHVMLEGSSLSATRSYLFMKTAQIDDISNLTYHYWFDRDLANRVTDSIGDGTLLLDVAGLTDGLHTIHVMLEGNGLSSTESYMFVKIAVQEPEPELQYNCWFDQDYSTLTTGPVGSGIILLNVAGLTVGEHEITVQVNDGTLSSPMHFEFYRNPMVALVVNPVDGGTASAQLLGDTLCLLTATPNPDFAFVNWTNVAGQVISTLPVFTFALTEDVALVANFEAISVDITQTTTFVNGWTWWSTCIETAEADVLGQLKTGLGNSGQVIKSQTASTMHLGNNWVGSLTMTNENGYMVKSNAEVTVDITGPAATPEDHPITLNPGWTWIGYPSTETMTVAAALANHTPQANDVIKGQSVSAMYMAGAWRGSLTLTPGIGYMYKSNNSEAVTLTYATPTRMTEVEFAAPDTYWNTNYSAYPTNMTVLAVVELDGEELNSENYELAAFANGECRGSVKMMYVEPLDRYMALLTIAGEEASELHFGLYNVETGEESFNADETLNFEADAIVGSPDEPFVIRFRSTTDVDEWANSLQIFPNPVEHGQTISLGKADDMGVVQVEIVNALGTVVETLRATSLQNVIVPNTAGVYTLRITVEGKGMCYRKLVVR